MQRNAQYKRGFTVVELLIVVVVIAILAVVTTVAYNGIQQRAVNVQNEAEASQAVRLLKSYYALNGSYPSTNGAPSVCIGAGFANYTGDPNGDCWDTLGSHYKSVDPAFNSALATVGAMNNDSKAPIPYRDGVSFVGPVFSTPSESGNTLGYIVQYWVYGSTCPSGTKVWAGTITVTSRCALTLN